MKALETLRWNRNQNADRLEEVLAAFDANDPDLLPARERRLLPAGKRSPTN